MTRFGDLKMYRIILFSIFLFFHGFDLFFAAAWAQYSSDSRELTLHQRQVRDIFQQLIEINTTLDYGSSTAAEAMAKRFQTAGFPMEDMHLIGPEANHRNLVVRYRGQGSHPPILFICHLDVVQAHREDWSLDPFTFVERDGYFYGRGTTDMKNEVADMVANFIRLKQEGFIPNRDLILALTDDEEGGEYNGIEWLLTNHRELIEAEYCINPDAGGGNIDKGRYATLTLQSSEKIYISYRLEVKNKGGHSSLPVKDNAIYRLAAALVRLSQFDFPMQLNETSRTFFERLSIQETGQMKTDILAMLRTPPDTMAAKRLSAGSAYYNAMLRTTCVPTLLEAGHAENALPQSARAVVNCRMLPDDNPENVLQSLYRVLADSQVIITCLNEPFLSPRSPLRRDIMESVDHLAAGMWPGVTVTPVMSTGASDGRFLRQAGIPVYGISGMFGDSDDVRAHGRDERIGVSEFYAGVEFMYRLIKILTSNL
jgi:acetylornithine deacetylase/succinyl-diaminopimelate desuccinylase-like protein